MKHNQKKMEQLLESAYYIAFNSMTFEVIGNQTESQEFMNKATNKLDHICRDDWFPEARLIIAEQRFIKEHELAQLAAASWLNRIMETSHLKVYLGGEM